MGRLLVAGFMLAMAALCAPAAWTLVRPLAPSSPPAAVYVESATREVRGGRTTIRYTYDLDGVRREGEQRTSHPRLVERFEPGPQTGVRTRDGARLWDSEPPTPFDALIAAFVLPMFLGLALTLPLGDPSPRRLAVGLSTYLALWTAWSILAAVQLLRCAQGVGTFETLSTRLAAALCGGLAITCGWLVTQLARGRRVTLPWQPVLVAVERAETRCPFCHDDVATTEASPCPRCAAPHHAECLRAHGKCAACGASAERKVDRAGLE
jgi:hypothetical protein